MSQNHDSSSKEEKAAEEDPETLKTSLLSRTVIVKDTAESAKIVSDILDEANKKDKDNDEGVVIGVDLEGIHLPKISLVQVRVQDGRIFIFRTGLNGDLFGKGRVKELLEDPRVTKVMHASVSDCQALYKAGIRIWGLFDTAVAHRVVQYQDEGESLVASKVISFNNICEAYHARANPLKDTLKDDVWKRDHEFADKDPLPADLTLYSAFDVEPLLEVYSRVSARISPDFRPLLRDLLELETIRSVDPELARVLQKELTDMEERDLVVTDLPEDVGKPGLYEAISSFEGVKKVLFNVNDGDKKSAHVIMPDRKSADRACRELAGKFESCSARLLHEMRPEEVQLSEEEQRRFVQGLEKEGFLLEVARVKAMVGLLVELGRPVVVEFVVKDGNALMEVWLKEGGKEEGAKGRIRFHVTKESIEQGDLKSFFESPAVVKITDRLDSPAATTAFKILSSCSVRPKNFFDLTAAFRMLDFWYYGLTYYSGPPPFKLADCLKLRFGLKDGATVENRLIAHAELEKALPVRCAELLSMKTQNDVDVMVYVKEAREARKEMRNRIEGRCVHVYGDWGPDKDVAEVQGKLEAFLAARKLKTNSIVMLNGDVALVEMRSKNLTKLLVEALRREREDGMFNGRRCWAAVVGQFKVGRYERVLKGEVDLEGHRKRLGEGCEKVEEMLNGNNKE